MLPRTSSGGVQGSMAAKARSPVPFRLKEARMQLGLSQKQVGILSGMDPSVASARVNQYERGKHVPHYVIVNRMAKVLKVPAAYFYADDDALAAHILRFRSRRRRS